MKQTDLEPQAARADAPAMRPLRVVMLVENAYPSDIRVRNEAFTLHSAGHTVSIIAIRGDGEKLREDVDGIAVYRVPKLTVFRKLRRSRSGWRRVVGLLQACLGYFSEYFYFTSTCLLVSTYIGLRRGCDVIHAHNPPDTLFVVGLFHRIFFRKFVFDHHDLSPELYLSRFGLEEGEGGWVYRALRLLERWSLKASHVSIATNESYKEIQVARGGRSSERVYVVRNGPNLRRVRVREPDPRLREMGKTILAYVGIMNPQDGVDYLLRSLRQLRDTVGRDDFYCLMIGAGDSFEDLKMLGDELGLGDHLEFTGMITDDDLLMRYLSSTDICLDASPASPLNNHSTWIKIMEYMALGKPIVSSDLKESRYSARDAALYVPPNDEEGFARQLSFLMDRPDLQATMGEYGRKRVLEELQWDVVSQNLLRAYEALGRR